MINQRKKSISGNVLDKIQSGRIKMRPKIYFILKSIFIVISIFIIALFILYLISFITFSMRASGAWYLLPFGSPGIKATFTLAPWLLISLGVVLIIVLEILVKHFSFAYRRPVLYSLLVIMIFAFLGSSVIGKTKLHSGLFQRAQEGRLSVIGEMYRNFGMPKLKNVHRGIVSEITDSGFFIETPRGEILTIIIAAETHFPSEAAVQGGDAVVVLGERENSTIHAFGVREINDELNIFPQHRKFMPGRIPIHRNR
jgi:hypothetical protein